jgi:hypothetical protein
MIQTTPETCLPRGEIAKKTGKCEEWRVEHKKGNKIQPPVINTSSEEETIQSFLFVHMIEGEAEWSSAGYQPNLSFF